MPSGPLAAAAAAARQQRSSSDCGSIRGAAPVRAGQVSWQKSRPGRAAMTKSLNATQIRFIVRHCTCQAGRQQAVGHWKGWGGEALRVSAVGVGNDCAPRSSSSSHSVPWPLWLSAWPAATSLRVFSSTPTAPPPPSWPLLNNKFTLERYIFALFAALVQSSLPLAVGQHDSLPVLPLMRITHTHTHKHKERQTHVSGRGRSRYAFTVNFAKWYANKDKSVTRCQAPLSSRCRPLFVVAIVFVPHFPACLATVNAWIKRISLVRSAMLG